MSLKGGGYLAPDNSRIICIYSIARIFTACIFSEIFSHNKVLTPTKSYCFVELLGLNKRSGCSVHCTCLLQEAGPRPTREPQLGASLSTLTHLPVTAHTCRDYELLACQPVLNLPHHVIVLSPLPDDHHAPQKASSQTRLKLPCGSGIAPLLPADPQTPTAQVCFASCHQRLPKMFSSKIAVWNNSLSSSFFSKVSVKFKFYLVFFCWFVSSLIVFSIFPYCAGQCKSFHFWRTNLYYNYQLAQ